MLKQKEVEVVFNDEEMFKNADKLPGMILSSSFFARYRRRLDMKWADDLLYSLVQCPSDTCNGEYAYFYQLQIRSADEPMTTFLRVGFESLDILLSV